MDQPLFTPMKSNLASEQARNEIEETLHRTRSTMARQELLKRLWRLEAGQDRDTKLQDSLIHRHPQR